MGARRWPGGDDRGTMVFAAYCTAAQTFAALECAGNEHALAYVAHLWKVRLQLVTDAGEICVDGRRADVMAHKYDVEAEGFGGGFDGESMKATEFEVGIEGRPVSLTGGGVDGGAERDRTLVDQLLEGPGFAFALPRLDGGDGHEEFRPQRRSRGYEGLDCRPRCTASRGGEVGSCGTRDDAAEGKRRQETGGTGAARP